MAVAGLRVMYWPNEPAHLYPGFTQAGGRAAFEAMAADGTIASLRIYSQRVERARYTTAAAFEQVALAEIARFEPDILFVQHLQGTDVSRLFWKRLRTEMPGTTIVFHDDDPYDAFAKRIDAATAAVTAAADLVLLSGLGRLERLFRRHGARTIGYMPSCFPAERFGALDPATAVKTATVAMIGNRGRRRRLRFLHLPGGRRRAAFARRMSKAFGRDFALHGGGWDGLVSCRGALPYYEQEAAIQSARFSANWDHFDRIARYFSDRLPIALAAGVPHVTTWHAGFDEIFADCPGLYACKTVADAVATCQWLAGRPDEALREEGLAARRWAFANLEAEPVFRNAYGQSVEAHRKRISG